MKRPIHILPILMLTIGLISCDRIKHKSEQVADKVQQKTKSELRKQAQKVIDKAYPPFDHDQPDTENNKKRFQDFLNVKITKDVKNIYCFDDAIGIDADYMFAFNCSPETSNEIIEANQLTIDSLDSNNGFGLQHDFEWWDKNRIRTLQKYSWTNGSQHVKYYWYDKENEKAYFFDFDM